MTLEQAGKRYCIDLEKLRSYAENGLLVHKVQTDGSFDCTEDDIRQMGLIHSLMKAGMDTKTLKAYLQLSEESAIERRDKIQFLRKVRCRLLEDIHEKQQSLDEIDYIIDGIRKK